MYFGINPLNFELNTICHLLALLGAHHIPHVSRIRVKQHCSAFCSVDFNKDAKTEIKYFIELCRETQA